MKHALTNSGILFFPILLLLLFAPAAAFGQQTAEADSLQQRLELAARDTMTSAKTCALITVDQEGRPRVRVMDPFLPDNDFTVWLGTNPRSRKVEQIQQDPRVTLYYLAVDGSGYVMMQGTAQLIDAAAEKEARWKEGWEAFYPNKEEDYMLIKVTPEWIEVVSYTHDVIGDPITWEPPRLTFPLK